MLRLDELIANFKREKGFDRLFSLFIEKYKSYERIEKGISVVLQQPTLEEKRALSGFLGKDYTKNKSIKLTAAKMKKAILQTKYAEVMETASFQDIVAAYHGEPLVSKREEEQRFFADRQAYFAVFEREAQSELFLKLLEWIKHTKHNRFYQMYTQNKDFLSKVLDDINRAFALFPLKEDEYLAVFAANATGNPHAFDSNEQSGKMFLYALQIIYSFERDSKIRDLNAEERSELLYEFQIMTDNLLNFVSIFYAQGKNRDGTENQLLKGAVQELAFFHLPLKEVVKLDQVTSASGHNRVFIIENSSVAAQVVNELITHGHCETILSGNGQFKIATLKFLDAFVKNGGAIYYSGDFDPEGISMANRLKKRFGAQVHYWHYNVADYRLALSEEPISTRRLSQLTSIEDPELQPLIQAIRDTKKSGYQEKLLTSIITDLTK